MEIDQEIFNMMLAKSMHQIAWIEFRNSKFPYARGLCPLATPARGVCPLDPHQGASPLEPPSLVNNLGPPFPAAGSAPEFDIVSQGMIWDYLNCIVKQTDALFNCSSTTKINGDLNCKKSVHVANPPHLTRLFMTCSHILDLNSWHWIHGT